MESSFRGQPKPLAALDPSARFARAPADASLPTVGNFWSWAFSDLRSNTTRGILAEYLVAWALGVRDGVRAAWDDFDVLTPEGIRVEVKASGYLQSWVQKRPSRIGFGRLTGRTWSSETGVFGEVRELRADVYVFAVHGCQEAEKYDPLDLDAWKFFVLPRDIVAKTQGRSISLGTILRLGASETGLAELASAVRKATSTESQ